MPSLLWFVAATATGLIHQPTITISPRRNHGRMDKISVTAAPSIPEDEEARRYDVKDMIAKALSSDGEASSLIDLIDELEDLCETDRLAASPMLDGWWKCLYCSNPPRAVPRAGRGMLHGIESAPPSPGAEQLSPGTPGLRCAPNGRPWDDVSAGKGAYVQRSRRRFWGTREVRATYTWLGGDGWDLSFASTAFMLLGVPLWRRRVPAGSAFDADLDHALRPTYVDGELLILRSPAVTAGDCELRPMRTYLLERQRNRLWQDDSFVGLSDRMGWEP